MTWNPPPPPALAADRFSWILNNLVVFISLKHRPGADLVLLALVSAWVVRLRNRFAALVARYRAGTLRPSRPPRPMGAGDVARRDRAARPPGGLPRGWAWLCPMVPAWAASCGNHVLLLLDEPEMREIIAAAPQAGRLLRPLLRMLGAPLPAFLAPPPRKRRARDAAAPMGPAAAPALDAPVPRPPAGGACSRAIRVTRGDAPDLRSPYAGVVRFPTFENG